MRKLVVGLVLATLLTLAAVVPAFAHAHGITPLSSCTVDNPNSGANGTNGTPAADANGGPIVGLIARDTGNAPFPNPLVGDEGGKDAPVQCP